MVNAGGSQFGGPRQPIFNNIPGVVMGLFGAIAATSIALFLAPSVLPPQWLYQIYQLVGVDELSRSAPLAHPWGYVLHVFAHGGFGHLLMNAIIGLAISRAVANRLCGPGSNHGRGAAAFVLFFFACSIVGAATQVWVDHVLDRRAALLIGASTGVSGLLAAAMYVVRAGVRGPLPRVTSRPYLTALAPWIALNLIPAAIVIVAPSLLPGLATIAWMSHVGGLAAGAVLFPLADAWARGPTGRSGERSNPSGPSTPL